MNRQLCLFIAGLVLLSCTEEAVSPDAGPDDVDASRSGGTICRSDRECSATGRLCNLTTGYCVQCIADDDCEAGRACRRSACEAVMPCTSSRMCPGLVCDRDRGYCVECASEADCVGDDVCEEGFCVPPPQPCESDRECSGLALVCDPELRHCVECVADTDCPSDRYCSDDRRCAPDVCEFGSTRCASDTAVATCTSNGSGYGPAAECGAGASCSDGACQAPMDAGMDAGPGDGRLDAGVLDASSAPDSSLPREQPPVMSELGPVAASGAACDAAGVLARGGSAAGLARADNGALIMIDGWNVAACVTADFGTAEAYAELLVVAQAQSTVCAVSCEVGLCGTGRELRVFRSTDGVTYAYVGVVSPTDSLSEHRLPAGGPLRYALVCRTGNGHERDHFLVDYLAAIRP